MNGLRTERVTLEITQRAESYAPCRDLDWQRMLRQTPGGLFPGESVRVVEETHFDDLAQVVMERDAALRERDAAKEECERLCARVAELESSAKLAPAANAGGVSNPEPISGAGKSNRQGNLDGSQEPVAWGFPSEDGSLANVSTTQPFPSTSIVVPLYAAPQPLRGWLTEEEREAVEEARDYFEDDSHEGECKSLARALRSLLARAPQPLRGWLTEEERDAVEDAIVDYGSNVGDNDCERIERVLRALLARSTQPPRGWLTSEERDAVDHAADIIEDMEDDDGNSLKRKADVLRSMLARETQPPRWWLNSEERRTLENFVIGLRTAAMAPFHDEAVRSSLTKQANDVEAILDRETPPRVRRPQLQDHLLTQAQRDRDDVWIAAIREAGGEVE